MAQRKWTKKSKEYEVEVGGRSFTLRTSKADRLLSAAAWINRRLKSLADEHPLMKPTDLQLLLLLELGVEREEVVRGGKELLNEAQSLLQSVNKDLARGRSKRISS